HARNSGRLLEKNIDIGFEARVAWFRRIGKIFLDEAVLRFEAFFIEKSSDEIVGRIDIVVGAAMQELHRLAGGRLANFYAIGEILALGFRGKRDHRLELKAFVAG